MPLPERALITQIRRLAQGYLDQRRSGRSLIIVAGIGDDCAVLRPPPGRDLIVTTDFSLEQVHFRREWHSPESVGHRCLARGLSDIAAMGGEPEAVFLSLALPADVPQSWVRRFTTALVQLAERYGATLAGGDTAQSPAEVLADIIVLGTVPKGKAILRSGARPGDRIFVSGQLGGSAAALTNLKKRTRSTLKAKEYRRHFYPDPRIAVGRTLREQELASAMIDTSDGLSIDLAHICEESGVGAEIDTEAVPRACVGKSGREVDLELALHGGEDYELLFTARADKRIPREIAGIRLTQIGRITRKKSLMLLAGDGKPRKLDPRGWEHFRK